MVWIVPSGDATKLDFAAISDSAIVSGLIYLALRVYSGRSAAEILATEPAYIDDIGLAKHLSPTRNNGLAALLGFIRDTAQRARRERTVGADSASDASRSLLRNRGFTGLLFYRLLAMLSYQIVAVTVGWQIYQITRDRAGARPDRPGRSRALFLLRTVRRLRGRPSAAAQARHVRPASACC